MPLLSKIAGEHYQVGLWKLTEPYEVLISLISPEGPDKAELERFTVVRRKREFLAVRLLLADMTGSYPCVEYDKSGRPSLTGTTKQISISHSRSMVAAILADFPTGIDAEESGRDISGIAGRFLGKEELSWTAAFSDPSLAQTFCWCCKEAVFKKMGMENVEFKNHISVLPVELTGEGTAGVIFQKPGIYRKIGMRYRVVENNVVAWCVNS